MILTMRMHQVRIPTQLRNPNVAKYLALIIQGVMNQMLLPLNCVRCVTVESTMRLEVNYKEVHKYLCDFKYMNNTPPKLIEIIKEHNKTKKDDVQLSGTVNIEQNRVNQKLPESDFGRNVDTDIGSDSESENAFQDQLDAEIQRDVEIEKEISKVFQASSIYKKFLDKEVNDPIEDNDVCIIDAKEEVFVISDTDSETSKLVIDTDREENIKQEITESDVDIENTSNHSVIEENLNNVKIESDIERKDDLILNRYIDFEQKDVVKDMNTEENLEFEIKEETDIKEEIEYDENIINNIDFANMKSEHTYEVDLNTGCSKDWSIKTPGCKNRKQEKPLNNYELWINKDKKFKCTQCSYTGCYREYIDHIMNCFHTKCTYCMKSFNDVKLYLRHLSDHKLKYLSCPQCFKKFYLIQNLKHHIIIHIHELYIIVPSDVGRKQDFSTYICNVCDGIVKIEQFFIHWEGHLELNEAVEDEMSDKEAELKSMMTPEMVDRVIEILTNPTLNKKHKVCIVCSKIFVRRLDNKRHLIEHLLHEAKIEMAATGARLRCPICDQHFQDLPGWRQHLREHSHIKTYRCSLCPKKFCDSSNFSKHRKVHNQHKYICDLCGGKFCAKTGIIRHLKTHEPMNPLPCSQCDRIFDSDNKLRKHMRIKHNKYPLSCPVCRRKFKTCKQRWDHMWDKHKLRKSVADCPICKKQYRRTIDVKNHLKSAHGSK
ncbi:PREDICTED: zinc finger protein Xfin-like isoform X2 [Papilio polytes]|uniref:zinc finger protein Xfin-like isoform X2 n=1 Tax=Papilio polytes TaxID=76194 RepID=UPI0006762DE7|nr:PREDICTED: zinc finger protein Xfin-like isoform X2 [Papilio polytes]